MTEDKLREIIKKEMDAILENSKVVKPAVELEITEPIDNSRTDEEISVIIESLNINEGQFSWFTSDTLKQIGSERQNSITVYMHDNEGNSWKEKNYEGYGVFGGYDYYSLLAKMNGYSEDRDDGIDVAFNKKKSKTSRKVLFPALTESPKLPRNHDFTKESDSDPNQSWYQEEEYEDFN